MTHFSRLCRLAHIPFLIGFLLVPSQALAKTWVFPQVFNVGSGNFTDITIKNSGDTDAGYSVRTITQNGEVDFPISSATLPPDNLTIIGVPDGLVGSVIIDGPESCELTVQATWNFNLPGGTFAVGVAPLADEDRSQWWDFALGRFLDPDALIGLAVLNRAGAGASCQVSL